MGFALIVVFCFVGSSCAEPEHTKPIIRRYIVEFEPDIIISGECPDGGVDIHTEEVVKQEFPDIQFRGYPPKVLRWKGKGGYKERNLNMAIDCTHCVSIRSLRSTTYGSGWTVDKAEELGKIVYRETVS